MASYDRKDHFHQRAKREGFRSRAAYKLAEIQRAHRLLRRGQRVLDLGCWPGGWLQVSAAAVGEQGRVVGLDLAAVDPPLNHENVVALVGDITQSSDLERVLSELGGAADVLLCDAAPKLTGQRDVDRAHEETLLESVAACLPRVLRPGGDLLLKILEGPEAQAIERRLRTLFASSRSVKVSASRKGTSERYLLARDYRGPG